MITSIWDTFFYEPLYNALIFLVGVVPGGDVGIAVIILTVLVKFALYPLSQKSIVTQLKMRSLEGEISAIKERYKDKKEEQARQTMALYKKHQVNPFSGCITVLIQLPIILALYFVFLRDLAPVEGILYSFVHFPEVLNPHLLGIFDLGKKSVILALIAGVAQYYQMDLTLPKSKPRDGSGGSFADEFTRSMNTQMRYVLPVMIIFIAYTTSGAVALYWATSSLFAIGQELLVRRRASASSISLKS